MLPITAFMVIAACPQAPSGMVCIEGGAFIRGSNQGPVNERPQQTIEVDTFYMDTYEVTVEQFQQCVTAKKCKPAKTNYPDFSRPKQPKVGIKWFDADNFCRQQGKHLPTEAEWEKAARGTDGRTYPWGNAPATCEKAVIMNERGERSCGIKKLHGHPEKGRTEEVGTRPPTPPGLYDIAGNSWEWVADWSSTSYGECGEACGAPNPRGPCDGRPVCPGHSEKVVRGGSWYWPKEYATTTYRRFHAPENKPYHHFGFRCAASQDEASKLTAN